MIHVALTGNVAAGKSTVARLFAEWGATVIDVDAIVHDLQRPGTAVFEAMVARFGTTILRPDGALDRPAIRRMVLADPAARRNLEAIVHPAVAARREELVAEAERRGRAVVVSDIPLLFEATDPTVFEHIVLVDATPATRRDRLIRLRGLAPDEADRMLAAQMPSAGKRARSTEVIDNDGSPGELESAARAVWNRLEEAAANA
jgi:dephospho-CoA kinase